MKKIISIFFLFVNAALVSAQDAHYTQFENSPFYINPGSAGMPEYGDFRGNLNTRNQWHKLVKPSRTTTMSFDAPILKYLGESPSKSYLGVGGYFSSAAAGDAKTKQSGYGLIVSGITTIGNNKFLGLGIGAGRGSMRANLSNATWDEQYDGYQYNSSLPVSESLDGAYRASYWDFSTGLNYMAIHRKTGNSTNIGISYLHFTNPRLKKTDLINGRVDPRLVFHMRTEINMEIPHFLPIYLIPRLLFGHQGVHNEIQAGLSVFVVTNHISQTLSFHHKEGIEVGAMYRHNDAVGILAGYKKENWKLGVGYDITISRLGEAVKRRGGAELSLTYIGFNPNLKEKRTFY
ncbi:MAG TPA: PorP/SprF family type IX secretion system membrane protein [Flavobacteriales bacterium]|nr:PorP/SprF family type IX secretion system membrane protein [Flavobacteriales bacterium]